MPLHRGALAAGCPASIAARILAWSRWTALRIRGALAAAALRLASEVDFSR
jgi:hypothetical protein